MKTPWDERYETLVGELPESDRDDVSLLAWCNFQAFEDWLSSQGVEVDTLTAADLLSPFLSAIDFGIGVPELVSAHFEAGTAELTVQHAGIKALAYALGNDLGDAPNFVTCEVHHPERGPIVVTVQKKRGKSPAEIIGELRMEVERLKGELSCFKS